MKKASLTISYREEIFGVSMYSIVARTNIGYTKINNSILYANSLRAAIDLAIRIAKSNGYKVEKINEFGASLYDIILVNIDKSETLTQFYL